MRRERRHDIARPLRRQPEIIYDVMHARWPPSTSLAGHGIVRARDTDQLGVAISVV